MASLTDMDIPETEREPLHLRVKQVGELDKTFVSVIHDMKEFLARLRRVEHELGILQ